ncbi:Zinc-binding oxidoreductase [Mycena venus]|uniref:Zinc-binding oxidoreductase n=1 Tax=Mycena venus TaxID=2733690 RepID=A0A8H7CLD0_9AGAR|nr:Zinc-binding oxidoreductase [Mycena venus]
MVKFEVRARDVPKEQEDASLKPVPHAPRQPSPSTPPGPSPRPPPPELLIRVHAIALNPADATFAARPLASSLRVLGSDFAGEVVSSSTPSNDPRCRPGARVAGFLQGACSANERPGAFAEFISAASDLVWLLPDGMTYQEAAAVSLCALTGAQAVFPRLGLPCPFFRESEKPLPGDETQGHEKEGVTLLIYGASTSIGLYAAQWARLSEKYSGRRITLVGVASTKHHEMLRREPYVYDVLVDYKDEGWVNTVRAATPGGRGVDLGIDAVTEGRTVYDVDGLLRDDANSRFCVFRAPGASGYKLEDLRVRPEYGNAWDAFGVELEYYQGEIPRPFLFPLGHSSITISADPQAKAFAEAMFKFLTDGAREGKTLVRPNPVRKLPGGLSEKIARDGFYLLRPELMGPVLGVEVPRTEEYMRPISGGETRVQIHLTSVRS